VDTGTFAGAANYSIQAFCANGSIAVGQSSVSASMHATQWTFPGHVKDLGTLPGGFISIASAINADGSIIVGSSSAGTAAQHAVKWTAAGIAPLGGGDASVTSSGAIAINAQGDAIGGFGSRLGLDFAAIWTDALGMADLNALLPTLGINLSGWNLTKCVGVGPEGRVLIGDGIQNGKRRAWIAFDLPALSIRCSGDLTRDWLVNDSDFGLFAVQYGVLECASEEMPASCSADLNADGYVDDADFTTFVVAYDALICP